MVRKKDVGYAGFKLLHLQRSPYSRDLRRGWGAASNLARSIPDATVSEDTSVAFAASIERTQGSAARVGTPVTVFDRCLD